MSGYCLPTFPGSGDRMRLPAEQSRTTNMLLRLPSAHVGDSPGRIQNRPCETGSLPITLRLIPGLLHCPACLWLTVASRMQSRGNRLTTRFYRTGIIKLCAVQQSGYSGNVRASKRRIRGVRSRLCITTGSNKRGVYTQHIVVTNSRRNLHLAENEPGICARMFAFECREGKVARLHHRPILLGAVEHFDRP